MTEARALGVVAVGGAIGASIRYLLAHQFPGIWTVLVINFLALGLIWAYVQRTYPSFEAARYWTGSALMCATAAAVATLRGLYDDSLLPLLAAGSIMVLATCLAAMGIRCFYEKQVDWQRTALITINAFVGMFFFPYSPRWLASKDRWEEALKVLAALHGKGDINHPKVLAEYQEIEEALRFEREQAVSSFKALVEPRMLKRVLL